MLIQTYVTSTVRAVFKKRMSKIFALKTTLVASWFHQFVIFVSVRFHFIKVTNELI